MLKEYPFTWTCGCSCINNDFFEPSVAGPFINVTCDGCGAATDIATLSPIDRASYNAAVHYYTRNASLPNVEQASRRIRDINDQYDAVFGHRDWVNSDLPDMPGGSAALDELIELQEIVDAHKAGREVSPEFLRAPAPDQPDLPLYLKEFPEMGPLGVEIPLGFEDTSWHNDICRSFSKVLSNGQKLRLWLDHKEPADRENPEWTRFSVTLYDDEDGFVRNVAGSDDYSKVVKAIGTFEPVVALTP